MADLFEKTTINTLGLKNRFVRSATWEGLATTAGAVTPALTDMMAALAEGGVGLIISSHAYVSEEGQGTPRQLGVHSDDLVPGLKEMAAAVHRNGGRIALQLAHAGLYALTDLTGKPALAVSESPHVSGRDVKPATREDLQRLVEAYAQGARRALAAGFDGVQIHSAHGYFLSQLLSPAYNRREDDYGGPIENRARLHLQIYRAVRAVVGDGFPILIKMNCADFLEDGLTIEDALEAARLFEVAGFDAIEVSGGVITGGKLSPSRPGIGSAE